MLTAFDGHAITYDGSGNPLSYYNGKDYTMTWRNGRQLASVAVNGKTYSYEYDVNGLRTRKTNADGGYTQYYIVDGLTVAEQRFTASGTERYTLRYLFDESNSPVGFGIQYPSDASTYWKNYYFAKNLQGDVIALYSSDYNSSTDSYYGTLVATYEYDPWGKPTGIYKPDGYGISQTASHVAAYNPFRYRGYRYDADTGFYYLQSRYYDPAICRFINADEYSSTGQGIIGHNMFAYCNNDPINRTDVSGCFSWKALGKIVAAVAVVAVATVACVATAGLAAAAVGASTAVVSAVTAGAAVGGVVGGATEIIGQCITNGPENLDVASVAIDTVTGSMYGVCSALCSSAATAGTKLAARAGIVLSNGINTLMQGVNNGDSAKEILRDTAKTMAVSTVLQAGASMIPSSGDYKPKNALFTSGILVAKEVNQRTGIVSSVISAAKNWVKHMIS